MTETFAEDWFNLGLKAEQVGDLATARARYQRAAELGHTTAMYNLGALAGRGGEMGTARTWWTRAAENGDPDAMRNIGFLAQQDGDRATARSWYKRAAASRNAEAMNDLGVMAEQDGDRATARTWYRRAADLGHSTAMQNLAQLPGGDGGTPMRMTDVDFSAPVFEDHPQGWKTPSDLVAGFTLAWALELNERKRLSPHDPFANWVRERLPAQYRFDTLGSLVYPGAAGAAWGWRVARLTTLCGAWQLFDLMNQRWRIQPDDYDQYADLLAFVTGGRDRPSLLGDLGGNFNRSLLALRVRRAFSQVDELDPAEEWFVTGNDGLTSGTIYNRSLHFDFHPTVRDRVGRRANIFLPFPGTGPLPVPLPLMPDEFVVDVWSTARATVDQLGPDRTIALHRNRLESLSDLLIRGGEKALRAHQGLSPMEFGRFNYWPGWA